MNIKKFLLFFLPLFFYAENSFSYNITLPASTPAQVYFSPQGGAQAAIIDTIARANRTIRVQAYVLTAAPVAKALIEAHRRGVDVRVLVDSGAFDGRGSVVRSLSRAGIPVHTDPGPGLGHNKVMILDNRTLVTGSYNWTRAAEMVNAENLLILEAPDLAREYARSWERRAGRSN